MYRIDPNIVILRKKQRHWKLIFLIIKFKAWSALPTVYVVWSILLIMNPINAWNLDS